MLNASLRWHDKTEALMLLKNLNFIGNKHIILHTLNFAAHADRPTNYLLL